MLAAVLRAEIWTRTKSSRLPDEESAEAVAQPIESLNRVARATLGDSQGWPRLAFYTLCRHGRSADPSRTQRSRRAANFGKAILGGGSTSCSHQE